MLTGLARRRPSHATIVAYLRQVKPIANKTDKSTYKIPLPESYGPPVTSALSRR